MEGPTKPTHNTEQTSSDHISQYVRADTFLFIQVMATVQLSAEETALYDRQIRLWGVDAQHRYAIHPAVHPPFSA